MAESAIDRAACIGGGVIGAGWIARLVLNGLDVTVHDPGPGAAERIGRVVHHAGLAWAKLTDAPLPQRGTWQMAASMAEAATAPLIIESAPERLDLKRSIYREIEHHAAADATITSSTSGFRPSDLQQDARCPGRIIVAHPFNPVYLLPLVELVGGPDGDPAVIARAGSFFEALGMKPLLVRREIDAFIADRLLEAVWREALWLVRDGVATTEEIDDAIRFGFGLRWAQMGLFETYRIAGGEAGMRHFLSQFGPSLQWPWSRLTDVPELSEELVALISAQSDTQSGKYSIAELERIRDDNLVAILQALKRTGWGAGEILASFERKLREPQCGPSLDPAQ